MFTGSPCSFRVRITHPSTPNSRPLLWGQEAPCGRMNTRGHVFSSKSAAHPNEVRTGNACQQSGVRDPGGPGYWAGGGRGARYRARATRGSANAVLDTGLVEIQGRRAGDRLREPRGARKRLRAPAVATPACDVVGDRTAEGPSRRGAARQALRG